MTPALDPSAVDDALARSVIYRTLSLGFQRPTAARLAQIGARDRWAVLSVAADHLDTRGTAVPLHPAVAPLRTLAPPDIDRLASTFARLFGHTARGLVCACEAEYGPDNAFHQPQTLADISGYYLAFGLEPALAADTRLDHIGCECEFMDFLNRKQALLLENADAVPDRDTLEATVQAERTFLRDHLGRFGRAFAARVTQEDAGGFYDAMGGLLLTMVEAECARVGVGPGPVDLALAPDTADDAPMFCGSSDDLIQIQRSPVPR